MINPPQLICYTYSKGSKINLSYPLWCKVNNSTYLLYADSQMGYMGYVVRRIDNKQPVIVQYTSPARR